MNYLQRDDSKGPLLAAKIHVYMFCMRKKNHFTKKIKSRKKYIHLQ